MWTPILTERDGPLYRGLADAIAAAIDEGDLGPGDRLPTQRDLAGRLGIALTTVTRGYAEAERRGLIRGEVGRGTFVRTPTVRGPAIREESAPGDVDLRANVLVPWPFGPELLDRAARHLTQADPGELFAYGAYRGQPTHCEAGAELMRRVGLDTDVGQVVVTTGVQHGITVVLAALCSAGDAVLVGEVTYSGFRAAARVLGIRLVPIPLDAEGPAPDAVREAVRTHRPKALICTPTLHNPTSTVMSDARRDAIAAIVDEFGLAFIEDDSYGFVLPDIVPLAGRIRNAYYLLGTSKPLIPSLRVGYVRAPDGAAADRLEGVIAATVMMCSRPMADLASAWIRDGTLDRVAAWKREQFATRQAAVRRGLGGTDYQTHPKSPHGWLRLPEHWTTREFVHRAAMHRIHVAPAEDFAVGREAPHAVRLCVGSAPSRAALESAAATLASLVREAPEAGRMVV